MSTPKFVFFLPLHLPPITFDLTCRLNTPTTIIERKKKGNKLIFFVVDVSYFWVILSFQMIQVIFEPTKRFKIIVEKGRRFSFDRNEK
jgi:hypothetical protein